jgi:hypothetical protein
MAWSCRKPPPLGLASILDHRLRLPGRREDRFDLFLPDLGLLIDLDPAWTHGSSDSLVRDTAKTEAALAAGLDMERIRERGLPALPLSGRMHYEAGPGLDPGQWAEAVGQVLRRRGLPWKDLDPAQVRAAILQSGDDGTSHDRRLRSRDGLMAHFRLDGRRQIRTERVRHEGAQHDDGEPRGQDEHRPYAP